MHKKKKFWEIEIDVPINSITLVLLSYWSSWSEKNSCTSLTDDLKGPIWGVFSTTFLKKALGSGPRCARRDGNSPFPEKEIGQIGNGGHGGSCFTNAMTSIVNNLCLVYVAKRKNWKALFLHPYFYKVRGVKKLSYTSPWSYLTSNLSSRLLSYLHRCIEVW